MGIPSHICGLYTVGLFIKFANLKSASCQISCANSLLTQKAAIPKVAMLHWLLSGNYVVTVICIPLVGN